MKNRLIIYLGIGTLLLIATVSYFNFINLGRFSVDTVTQQGLHHRVPKISIQSPTSEKGFYAPVLMYHHIALKQPEESYYVSPETFKQQMQWLKDNDYHVISYDDFYNRAKSGIPLPDKSAVLTFDDGDEDQYQNAFPILKQFNYPATFYIITARVGGQGYMTWEQIAEMAKAGMTIGSHSVNHKEMAKLNVDQLRFELTQSKVILEQHLGIPIKYFCYPGGSYSLQVSAEAKTAGYLSATTTHHAVFHDIKNPGDLFTITRIHIDDEMPSFIQWIQGQNLK